MISGGLLSLATVALALGGTGVEVEARKGDFHSISKGLTTGKSKSTKTTKSSGKKTVSASIKCSSSGYAAAYSDWESSYIKAVANVVKDVCSSKFKGDIVKTSKKMTGFAKAWARATAKTSAECVSKTKNGGKASGCAYASASASAYEKAFASAHASASAEAFAKYCTCADAEAWSFGDADLFIKLTADAYAQAESTACASGNQLSSASASVDCQAHIFAQTYAFAAAKAVVDGKCYKKGGSAKARTAIEAAVDAEIYDESECVITEKKKGLSGNSTKGKSSTRSRSGHKGKK